MPIRKLETIQIESPETSRRLSRPTPQIEPEISAPTEKNFFSRVAQDLNTRKERVTADKKAVARGELTAIESGVRLTKESIFGVFDVAFEGAVSAFRGLDEFGARFGARENPFRIQAQVAARSLMDSPKGQAALNALNGGIESYAKFKEENTRFTENMEAVLGITAVLPFGRAGQVISTGIKKKVEQEVIGAGVAAGKKATEIETRLATQKIEDALEVTRVRVGELTAKEKKELLRTGKTETKEALGGLSRKEVITVTDRDRKIADAVSDVVSTKQGASENIKGIRNKISRVSEEIDVGLRGNNTIYNKAQLRTLLNELREDSVSIFGREKTLVNQYDDVVDFFMKTLEKHPKNNTGLLAARKEFDFEFKKRFPKIFEKFDSTDSGRVAAFQNVRRRVNDIVSDSLPEGNTFKPLLKQQNLMFDAIDNISLKGAKNLETGIIERALQAIDAHGIRTLVISGSLLGFTFLTSPAVIIPLLAGAVTIKIAGKVFKSQAVKKALIDVLRKIQTTGAKLNKAEAEATQKTIALLSLGEKNK